MVYSEQAVDIGLAVGVVVLIILCCLGTIITTLFYNRRQFRPREDSGESLV
jgi:peptidoglycan biosynthesis protein MviN/MurJ (putative lipid II flippase)